MAVGRQTSARVAVDPEVKQILIKASQSFCHWIRVNLAQDGPINVQK